MGQAPVLVLLMVAACGSKHPTAGPDALANEARCRQAVDKMAKLETVTTPPPADLIEREVQHCMKKYTNAIVDCIDAANERGATESCYKSRGPKPSDGDAAVMQVKQVAFEAYPLFTAKSPDTACPRTIADLAPYITGNKITDPWGHELRLFCGAGSPVPFGVASSGPDGKPDTADDIKSW
jgi:hypothetical protein